MSIYEFEVTDLQGRAYRLDQYRGKVLLIVNTASQCGFTPQYEGLQALYDKYEKQGLVILGFPCNQFGQQEKGTSDDISSFCSLNFGVSFPMHEKIEVNGPNAHPLYQYLKEQSPGLLGTRGIKWNFTKFLVGRDGQVIDRFGSTTKPASIEPAIKPLLES